MMDLEHYSAATLVLHQALPQAAQTPLSSSCHCLPVVLIHDPLLHLDCAHAQSCFELHHDNFKSSTHHSWARSSRGAQSRTRPPAPAAPVTPSAALQGPPRSVDGSGQSPSVSLDLCTHFVLAVQSNMISQPEVHKLQHDEAHDDWQPKVLSFPISGQGHKPDSPVCCQHLASATRSRQGGHSHARATEGCPSCCRRTLGSSSSGTLVARARAPASASVLFPCRCRIDYQGGGQQLQT